MPKKDTGRAFTVRLDPKTSFGIDFFSNQLKYRTGAKFIEEAIGLKLSHTPIEYAGSDGEGPNGEPGGLGNFRGEPVYNFDLRLAKFFRFSGQKDI